MEDDFIERLYHLHHRTPETGGKRLGQTFLEHTRGALFASWIGTGKEVLDLGCRDGILTRHFVRGNRVWGVDIDSAALEGAKQYGITTQRANLNAALPFPDKHFDVVVLAETLEHLPYPTITLSEARRVLQTGGLFVGNAPLAYHIQGRWRVLRGKLLDGDPTHCQYFSYDSLRKLLQQFFFLEEVVPLKGERGAKYSVRLFARNVAFRCRKVQ